MEEKLIEFLIELNDKGLINNHDFDYEKEAKNFANKDEDLQVSKGNAKPVCGEVSFDVTTYSLFDKNAKYCHWSEGLNMIIEKNGVIIKLNSEEIQQIVKSLPRTVGGRY